jgi:hypothetical protein
MWWQGFRLVCVVRSSGRRWLPVLTVTSEQGWTQIQRKQPTIRRPKSLKVNGRYKLVFGSADDGTRVDCETVQSEMRSERNNRTLVNQLATDSNDGFEYCNRALLSHNHRGGITFSVDTPQEAARCMNLGICLGGRKHRVFVYTRSRADDLCTHCSAWGNLKRNCTASPRCGICSGKHRTNDHANLRNGKIKVVCPNCGGNHWVDHSSCKAKESAANKQLKRSETPKKDVPKPGNLKKSGKKQERKGNGQLRGAQKHSGPGRQ